MFSGKIKLALILLCVALLGQTALAQQVSPTPTDSSTSRPIGSFKNRVFEIKNRDPESLVSVLKLLGSGAGGSSMSVNSDFNTITVRDFPENIATIEEAIRRLDVPAPPTPGIEFHVHILIATNGAASSNPIPSELSDVIKQLQTTLSYKNYSLMTSGVHRSKAGQVGLSNKGVADFRLNTEGSARNSPIFYDYTGQFVTLDNNATGAPTVQIGLFRFTMRIPVETATGVINYESVGFSSPVNLREGEKVVVGTTTMQDKGLIVVLTARIIK